MKNARAVSAVRTPNKERGEIFVEEKSKLVNNQTNNYKIKGRVKLAHFN